MDGIIQSRKQGKDTTGRAIHVTNTLTLLEKFQAFRGKYFPERQLFLRSEGRVRFLTIGSYTQMSMASTLAILLGWGGVMTYAYFTRDLTLEAKNRTITAMSAQYQALSNDFSALEVEVERSADRLERRQRLLEEIAKIPEDSIPADPDSPNATDIPGSDDPASDDNEGPETSGNLTTRGTSSSFVERLFGTGSAEAAVFSNRDRRRNLLNRLQDIEARQRAYASRLREQAEHELDHIDSVLASTKIASDDLIRQQTTSATAVGGPFVAELALEPVFSPDDSEIFTALVLSQERLEMVTNALDSFPVGEPTEKYYLSSRFGRRVDPLKKVWAKHSGLDLAGWPGSAINATAPGKVVHAGWYGPYGNMVEIDHGNGFKTRYGHMRKIRVEKGDEITLGQHIGDMGKTGRATDTHVHYEVWFDGKVRDPMPYMKAANDVLEIQGRHEKASTE